ncbi:MAG: TlpA disulfide reductase family protein [Flavobacterium sp.]|nr:TlpA disulfide reductase family protein [Flavobacterium sp.]
MNKIIAIILVGLSLSANAQTKDTALQIKGKLIHINDSISYIYAIFLDGKTGMDSAKVVNGEYYFKNITKATSLVTLFCKPPYAKDHLKQKNMTYFLSEPTSIEVISSDSFSNTQVLKSVAHRDYAILEERRSKYSSQLSILYSNQSKYQPAELFRKTDSINTQLSRMYQTFMEKNPASLATPYALERYLFLISNNSTAKEVAFAKAVFSKFTKVQTNAYSGIKIKKKLASYDIKVGIDAPNFIQKDTSDNFISLSKIRKNKYILIDFWASWCAPCRKESPNLKELYKQFNPKGFDIISVSLDSDKQKWMSAIQADSLNWTHVSDLNYWKNNVALLYKVNAVPTKILIDKSGVIIGKYVGIDNQQLLRKKLSEIFQ